MRSDILGIERVAVRSKVYLVNMKFPELPARELEVLSWDGTYSLVGRDLLNGLLILLSGPEQLLTIEGAVS